MKRRIKIFRATLKKCRAGIAMTVFTLFASGFVFYLYGIFAEPFLYAFSIVAVCGILLFLYIFRKELKKAEVRERMTESAVSGDFLPEAETPEEEDYTKAIIKIKKEMERLQTESDSRRREDIDYYTAWVHQINTPISVIRMELGTENTKKAKLIESEIFLVEQYVDMVLNYVRLGDAGGCDLVIKEYPLDEILRENIRKYASQFILKKLTLSYDGTDVTVITDRKWFSCIFGQILSNAIKYTDRGTVTITLKDCKLKISDTGIGIAPEDIPRIFEKGFTGENGRSDKPSSGLGLYLCKKAAVLLNIPLFVESKIGQGSTFGIDLTGKIKK